MLHVLTIPVLDFWLPQATFSIARCLEIPTNILDTATSLCTGTLERRVDFLRKLFNIKILNTSIGSMLLNQFANIWSGEDESYQLLRQYVRKKVQDVISGKIHLNLEDAVSLPLQEMFVTLKATTIII